MPTDYLRHLNAAGLGLIMASEGFEPVPKPCPAGKPTVGHGHVVRAGESFPRPLTREEARDLLLSDLEGVQEDICRLVGVPLSDDEFSALVSFTFNLGATALATSTLLRKLNAGDYAGAADEFPRWDKARVMDPKSGHKIITTLPGLAIRRAAERALFLGWQQPTNQGA
jgi:lysozyme